MILADKIIRLRKICGWSQEELADRLNVSRQSVSKWEGAQSVPDLARVLEMSKLFGVSTDYLLKDDIEDDGGAREDARADAPAARRVSMEEANAFLSVKALTARYIALATILCALAVTALILMGAMGETGALGLSEAAAGGVGLALLFVIAAPGVGLYILSGIKTSPYGYMDTEIIDTEYGVSGMALERKQKYREKYARSQIIAALICVLSALPLCVGAALSNSDFKLALSLCATIALAGVGAGIFIRTGIIWASYEKLLSEGDYTRERKARAPLRAGVSAAYWLATAAVYVGLSLLTGAWDKSWIIWPVAALIYAAIMSVMSAARRGKE